MMSTHPVAAKEARHGRYSATLTDSAPTTLVHRDSIATAVRYRTQVKSGPTVIATLLLLSGVVFAGVIAAYAIAYGAGYE